MSGRRAGAAGGVAVAVLALAGCSLAPSDYWHEPQQSEDALPSFVRNDQFDPDASRLLAETDDGYAFYVSRKPDLDSTCLVIARTTTSDWTSGCAETLPVKVTLHGLTAVLDEPLLPESPGDEYRKLADGLFVAGLGQ
jgi:hypothetical protein